MKLLLADDHTLFRDTLVEYIKRAEPGADITLANDLPEAMDAMEKDADQDLVLLDLRMPGMNGMEGLQRMQEKYPDAPVALISGTAEDEDVHAAMDMGAAGYFPKTLSGKALLNAIQLVLSGERFIPRDANNNIIPSFHNDKEEGNSSSSAQASVPVSGAENLKLTPRETEVLGYLAKGAANKEIANALDVQVVTIKLHVRGICRKLGVKNRTQAALKARELGITS